MFCINYISKLSFYTKHNVAVPCLVYNIKILYKYLAFFLGATHLTFVNQVLPKHAYLIILKMLLQKKKKKKIENFQIKNSDIFHISAQNIDSGYSLELPCPQSMFLSRNKKSNVYPCKPQFYYIKVESKGVKII